MHAVDPVDGKSNFASRPAHQKREGWGFGGAVLDVDIGDGSGIEAKKAPHQRVHVVSRGHKVFGRGKDPDNVGDQRGDLAARLIDEVPVVFAIGGAGDLSV